jgi:antitoxin (DNA-binding transcriptional repressor) of toxin-antitoxin stability system
MLCFTIEAVTVRDLRQRWPKPSGPSSEGEIIVTRDAKPVAKLIRYAEPTRPRARFDPAQHGQWQRRTSGGRVTRWVADGLLTERDER